MSVVFERKILKKMQYWKDELSDDYALLVEGARRVGKTTVVKEFVKDNYGTSIFIDFSKPKDGLLDLFSEGASDLDRFFLNLQRITKVDLTEHDSVIVFDEVQLCPQARQMIKHLVADGRYHYIETGSLISIKQNVKDILIPSEEYRIQMYPMDFEEFLWANGDRYTMELARTCFRTRTPMGRYPHKEAMYMFRLYMLVGGMPKIVSTYLEKNNFKMAEIGKRSILELYADDLRKIGGVSSGRCSSIFGMVPSLLSRHDKTFKANAVKEGSRMSDYLEAIRSLEDSKTVLVCNKCDDTDPAAEMYVDFYGIKLYMADTGLLFTSAFGSNVADIDETYDLILGDRLGMNQGMFLENAVAQELKASGHRLLYSRFRADDTVNTQEVNFILFDGRKVCPVEVKSGNSSAHVSLDRYIKKYKKDIDQAYVIHTKDLREGEDGILYVPAYMVSLLCPVDGIDG